MKQADLTGKGYAYLGHFRRPEVIRRGHNQGPELKKHDYAIKTALKAGLRPDSTGHMQSRVPTGKREGLILKKLGHPTFPKTVEADRALGYAFFRKGGRLFSFRQRPDDSYSPISYEALLAMHERAMNR